MSMSRPEFALIPTLMFCDYFLTVAGAVLKERGYDQVFEGEAYELNPVWQIDIAQKQWFNPRHTLLTLSITLLLFVIVESDQLSAPFLEGFLGCLCILFGIIIGKHLSNLLIFVWIARQVQRGTGSIAIGEELNLWTSALQYITVLVPMGLIVIFAFHPFALGGLLAVLLILGLHLVWIWRFNRTKLHELPPDRPEESA